MEQKRTQKLLRSQLIFRAGIFIIAFCCLATGILLQSSFPALSGIFIGVGGSAFVWSLVETIDFFLKTSHQYEMDRKNFIRILNDARYNLTSIFKSSIYQKTEIPWHEVYQEVNSLYGDIEQYSSNNSLYTISKEFYEISQYIIRALWLLNSNLSLHPAENHILPKDSVEYQYLYNQFVLEETEEKPVEMPQALINITERYPHRLSQKKLILSFESYCPDKSIFHEGMRGDLERYSSTDVTNYPYIETVHLKTFRPHLDIEEHMKKSRKYGVIGTVFYLAFRKIDEPK